MPVSPNEFRDKLIRRIDALLARTLLVWGDDRAILNAVRGYASNMTEAQLQEVMKFYTPVQEAGL